MAAPENTQQKATPSIQSLWTSRDVENYAGLSRTAVWKLRKDGRLSYRRIGRLIRFDPEVAREEIAQLGAARIFTRTKNA